MWNYLQNVRNKPLHTRKIILYVSTATLFALIVFIWILLLNIQKANESKISSEGILSPFDGIKEIFTKMFEGISTTNTPAIYNEVIDSGTIRTSNTNIETSYSGTNTGIEISTTTINNATGTPL